MSITSIHMNFFESRVCFAIYRKISNIFYKKLSICFS